MWITADGGFRVGKIRCVFNIGHLFNNIVRKTPETLK